MKNTYILQRLSHDANQTFGFVSGLGYKAHTLEDEPRAIKQLHETRIPAGIYKLIINKVDSPLTLKHRLTYNNTFKDKLGKFIAWFKYHIQLADVPGFKGIYIHSGSTEAHTSGCLLFASVSNLETNSLSSSLLAIMRFYLLVYPKLEKGEDWYIDVRDEVI